MPGEAGSMFQDDMVEAPVASVIIPAYNAADYVDNCLTALGRQETGIRFEVIVIDDGSTDATLQVVSRFPKVRLLTQDHQGPAVARNFGARIARGRIILFTDTD